MFSVKILHYTRTKWKPFRRPVRTRQEAELLKEKYLQMKKQGKYPLWTTTVKIKPTKKHKKNIKVHEFIRHYKNGKKIKIYSYWRK